LPPRDEFSTLGIVRIAVLIVLLLLAGRARAADTPLAMRYENGLLTVHLEHVPLDVVVAQLEQQTGIHFQGELLDWREVTKQFDSVPIAEALDRILGRQNFILRYDGDGRPASVELCGLPQPRQTSKTRKTASSANVLQLLGAAPPVTVSPALRAALHTSTVSLARLFLASLQQTDADVRAEARRSFLAAVEGNRPLRDSLSRADVKSIVPLVRSMPAERADALLLDLSQGSKDPMLRAFFARSRAQVQQDRVGKPGQTHG
jgi:hypothetical protein